VVKTTANQERAVAALLEKAALRGGFDIRSILVPEELKGYALVETPHRENIEQAMAGLHHARSVVRGTTTIQDIAHFLVPKAMVTGISEGAIVEVTSGPFKGEKARIKRIDSGREEITVELFDALVPIPVTLRGDHVRVLTKEETETA
jgi:transcriptional antiterminator NusG